MLRLVQRWSLQIIAKVDFPTNEPCFEVNPGGFYTVVRLNFNMGFAPFLTSFMNMGSGHSGKLHQETVSTLWI